jgi:glutamate--cysteine ligase
VSRPTRSLRADDVADWVRESCFASGDRGRVGVELEWLPEPPPSILPAVAAALPLGSIVTFEPGGQVELSTPPLPGAAAACDAAAVDAAALRAVLDKRGIQLVSSGIATGSEPRPRIHPAPRYAAMERFFDRDGDAGRTMMTRTAALQINLDAGDGDDVVRRWQRAHAAGPALAAAFANSAISDGRPSGHQSARLAIWQAIDRSRTKPAGSATDDDPLASWTAYVLDARVMLIRDGADACCCDSRLTFREWVEDGHADFGYPTRDDLAYHATTLFPAIRPKGWLELRMIDALPDPWWRAAVTVASAVITDPTVAGDVAAALEPTHDMWAEAARDAVADPMLATAAAACFEATLDAMPRLGVTGETAQATRDYYERFVVKGRCPADEQREAWEES